MPFDSKIDERWFQLRGLLRMGWWPPLRLCRLRREKTSWGGEKTSRGNARSGSHGGHFQGGAVLAQIEPNGAECRWQ